MNFVLGSKFGNIAYRTSGSRILVRAESRDNGSEGPNAGGPGGEGPPDGSEVSFLKRFKVLENESIFQKENIFLASKSIFSKKNSKIIYISQESLSFF